MLLEAIYGVVSKNIMGYISKKDSGNWSWKKGLEDTAYGVVAIITVWGAKTLFNVELAPDAATGTFVYISMIWVYNKVYSILDKKLFRPDRNYKLFK